MSVPEVPLDEQSKARAIEPTPGLLRGLLDNVRAGLRLAFFLRVTPERFRIDGDQIVLLILLDSLITVLSQYVTTAPERAFVTEAIGYTSAVYLALFLGCYLVARSRTRSGGAMALAVVLLSISPATAPAMALVDWLAPTGQEEIHDAAGILALGIFGWLIVIIIRAIRMLFGVGVLRGAALVVLLFLPGLPFSLIEAEGYWRSTEQTNVANAPTAAEPLPWSLNVEDVFYDQGYLMDDATDALAAERPGIADLYFVGFGSTAEQDVFLREVESVKALFDRRFDTAERSVALINNPATLEELPIASVSNLWWTLSHLGEVMNPEEDILFLFLTSHGSRDHTLSVSFPPLELNQLPADYLKDLLDWAEIKWRVIVVSACYSGGFIDALADENSLIMTASRHDRTSFGCAHERDFTNFGEAYFDQQLRETLSFVEAFDAAQAVIAAREAAKGLTPSKPQIHIGSAIVPRLEALEARLRSDRPDD